MHRTDTDARAPHRSRGGERRILGVRVDDTTLPEVMAAMAQSASSGTPCHVITLNPEYVMRARADAGLRAIIEAAAVVTADGAGITQAARMARTPAPRTHHRQRPHRRTCDERVSLFLLGAAPGCGGGGRGGASRAASRRHDCGNVGGQRGCAPMMTKRSGVSRHPARGSCSSRTACRSKIAGSRAICRIGGTGGDWCRRHLRLSGGPRAACAAVDAGARAGMALSSLPAAVAPAAHPASLAVRRSRGGRSRHAPAPSRGAMNSVYRTSPQLIARAAAVAVVIAIAVGVSPGRISPHGRSGSRLAVRSGSRKRWCASTAAKRGSTYQSIGMIGGARSASSSAASSSSHRLGLSARRHRQRPRFIARSTARVRARSSHALALDLPNLVYICARARHPVRSVPLTMAVHARDAARRRTATARPARRRRRRHAAR